MVCIVPKTFSVVKKTEKILKSIIARSCIGFGLDFCLVDFRFGGMCAKIYFVFFKFLTSYFMWEINLLAGLIIILAGLIFGPFIIAAICAALKDIKNILTGK